MTSAPITRQQGLDKFYTTVEYAKHCITQTMCVLSDNNISFDSVIEPSAGNGSFYLELRSTTKPVIGIDISPEHPEIETHDYLLYHPPDHISLPLIIGNPPFGKVSSLAVKFFNHSAKFAGCIAFIVPRTFRRPSIQNRLHTAFHLIHDEDTPTSPCCFVPAMSAKCCFQIWVRKEYPRAIDIIPTKHVDWEFLPNGPNDDNGQPTPPVGADFAIRAYGGKIGHIVSDTAELETLRPKSWHWIRVSTVEKYALISRFKQLDYSVAENTARQNSIGRGELVLLYVGKFDAIGK